MDDGAGGRSREEALYVHNAGRRGLHRVIRDGSHCRESVFAYIAQS